MAKLKKSKCEKNLKIKMWQNKKNKNVTKQKI